MAVGLLVAVLMMALLLAGAPLSVYAELMTGANASLVMPSSYEQYLALSAPTDVAFSEDHIAIADGGTLYLYDRTARKYSEHPVSEGRTITKIGFAGERLFLSDNGAEGNFFYEYNFSNGELDKQTFNCTTFCIYGDTLYTATVSNNQTHIGAYSVSALTEGTPTDLGFIREHEAPSMTVLDGTLYCAVSDRVYYPDPANGQFGDGSFYLSAGNPTLATQVKSVCAHAGGLCYTAIDGLYLSNITDHTGTLLLEGTDYGALTSYNGMLYAVQGTSIHRVDWDDEGVAFLSDYEIAAASSSVGRLSGAVDTARAGDLLVTADAENRRISVSELAHTDAGLTIASTYVIPCLAENGMPYRPALVATDGNLIAAAAGSNIYLYRNGETEAHYIHTAESIDIRGLACVYGVCYYITEYGYGKAEEGFSSFSRTDNAPKAIAADVYGNLYVVNQKNEVQSYSEAHFVDPAITRGTALDIALPASFTALRADFEGNLYCLSEGALFKNGVSLSTFGELAENLQFVYKGTDMPLSFALGYEDDEVFFLFGDYIVKTNAGVLDIPTLSKISAEGVAEDVFRAHGQENLLIDVPAGTIGVRTDLEKFHTDAPEYFPYLSYYRTEEAKRGILLATKGRYALVILYEVSDSDRVFEADLFLLEGASPVPEEEYFRAAEQTAYLSNSVSAYFFPCLHGALTDTRLARGASVRVKGFVTAPEREYALIEYTVQADASRSGEEQGRATGFVPSAYLTAVDPVPGDAAVFEPAYLKASAEGTEFVADDGTTVLITEHTRAEFTDNGDGTFTARITVEGKVYRATVTADKIDRGESDAVRIALIVILTALTVGIIGGYIYLLPRKVAPGKYEEFED